jgi:putative endonuclease
MVFCVSDSPQKRHPERSASQIYRKQRALWRGVEGPRGCLSYPCRSDLFNHRSPHRADPPRSFSWAENQELASILLCPAATSTFSGTLYIGVTSNLYLRVMQHITRARWKVSFRPMAASACSTLRVTKTFARPSLGEKQRKGWRREKKLNLIRTINPEIKDLSGFGGRKGPSSMGKIAPPGSFDSAPSSAVSHDKSVRRSAQSL